MNNRLQKITFAVVPAMITIGFVVALCFGIARYYS